MSNFYCTSTDPENPYRDSTTTTDNSINNSSTMTYIRMGQLYQHIPTGIIRRVVFADSNRVTFKEDATSNYSYCSIEDFKKFWKPYKENNKTSDKVNHPSHYTWLKEKAGIEVINITRWLSADISNAVKYLLRQGHKHEEGMSNNQKAIEDCKKAIWYINDYINNVLKMKSKIK